MRLSTNRRQVTDSSLETASRVQAIFPRAFVCFQKRKYVEDRAMKFGRIRFVDDDVWSVVSLASLASSCSLASEVLERARNRKEQFWGKNP